MAPEPNFESMGYKPFLSNNISSDNIQDFDVNFFFYNITSPTPVDTGHFSASDVKMGFSKCESSDTVSVLHLKIRSLSKNF